MFTGVMPPRQGPPKVQEFGCSPSLAQSEILVVDQLGGGKAVVQFDQVEIGWIHA
jgi:hypothetical protein